MAKFCYQSFLVLRHLVAENEGFVGAENYFFSNEVVHWKLEPEIEKKEELSKKCWPKLVDNVWTLKDK